MLRMKQGVSPIFIARGGAGMSFQSVLFKGIGGPSATSAAIQIGTGSAVIDFRNSRFEDITSVRSFTLQEHTDLRERPL